MKTCKKKLHQYPDELKRCPECTKITKNNFNQSSKGKASKKVWRQRPEVKDKERERQRSPKAKAIRKSWKESSEGKAKEKASRDKPEAKIKKSNYQKAWRKTPEGKLYQKKWRNSSKGKISRKVEYENPKRKEYQKEWSQSSKGKASKAVTAGKRTRTAAQGDLTLSQWEMRQVEFEWCCAYCHIKLLTKLDGVNSAHPQYLNLEHIIAITQGGQHTIMNIVPACRKCNRSKDNKDVWEWMQSKGIVPSQKLTNIIMMNMVK